MKKNFLIVAFWIFTLLGAFALKSNAQVRDKCPSLPSVDSVLLADETTLTETKTGAKIQCFSDKVHFKLYEKWQHCFIRYSWSWKKDRHGPYKEYVITVSKKDGELIKEWAKNNL